MQSKIISYTIDRENNIMDVGGDWDSFARDNSGEALQRENIIGRSILKCFDTATAEIYGIIFTKVRATQRTHILTIRCDSPGIRRELNLEMKPLSDLKIEFVSKVVTETPMAHSNNKYLPKVINEMGQALFMCSFCNLIKLNGEFHEIEKAEALGAFKNHFRYTRLFVVCPKCKDKTKHLKPE